MLDKIKNNRIIGILSDNSDDRINILEELCLKYKIKNNLDISNFDEETINNTLKLVGIKKELINKPIFELSETDKIKLKIFYMLLNNNDFIIFDEIFDILDNVNKPKMFKLVLKLKKYNNKTIFISTSDINNIFEIVDDIIYIKDNNEILYDDKYKLYEENELKQIPEIINFVNKVNLKYKDKHINYKDSINELIKELYRELR